MLAGGDQFAVTKIDRNMISWLRTSSLQLADVVFIYQDS